MAKHLIIVESPAKAKTVKKYLGEGFDVLASYGHIRDLIPKTGAVDPSHHFEMHYQLVEKNAKYANGIAQAMKHHTHLYLATDPDREGEAIAWHIHEFLKEKKALRQKVVQRITFNEITSQAIQKAVATPRELAMPLIDAQQARRALDYLVGFNLSPLLWKKVRRGLSAGRVQSPALRLIVERELEIEKFQTKEYWTIEGTLQTDNKIFTAKLIKYQGNVLKQFSITTEQEANDIRQILWKNANGHLTVSNIEKKERKRNPAAPFTTSTLQQEAAHKLGFTAQRTMRIAQQLHEGIEINAEPVGLITYMRTDSTTLAKEALQNIRGFIESQYGKQALPAQARQFRTKSKNAQEAHEAIRPTNFSLLPDTLRTQLSEEQLRLYELIWKRTIASQMTHAVLGLHTIELQDPSNNTYKASGNTIVNPGFMNVYLETEEVASTASSPASSKNYEARLLPELAIGAILDLTELKADQHFTEAPPRYNEASLIKTLESHGIGRPSTYVPIITTLQNREYVTLTQKRFYPTDVGRVVYQFLTNYFQQYIDYDFTAQLEEELDQIARGEKNRLPVLTHFWGPFKDKIDHIESTVQRQEVTQEALDENCPKCEKQLSKRLGKRGRFIGCSGYPECDYTRNLDEEGATSLEPSIVADRSCPQCQNDLHIKQGRYGKFIGCSHYPKCKHMEPLEKPSQTHVTCPECQNGELLERKSRYGKIFYSCAHYPKCQYAIWHMPIATPCPKCAWPILTIKTTKRKGTEHICPRKTCAHAISIKK